MTAKQSKAALWGTVVIPFALGYLASVLFRSVNAVLAHPLMQDLGLTAMELGLITSTFVLALALAQVPLGLALDWWGARRTQTVFFVLAGAGAILFGLVSSVWMLACARALLGFGMGGGLMAAFKAIAQRVDKERQPFYNGIVLGAGGLGALFATTPAKLIESAYGWRALSIGLGVLTLAVAGLIFIVNRDVESDSSDRDTLRTKLAGLWSVYTDRVFWRIVPVFVISIGGFFAMQGLWLGPWLQHVEGLSPVTSAEFLSVIAIAMTLGLVSGGLFSRLASRLKWRLGTVIVIGITLHVLTEIVIVTGVMPGNYVIWFLYGYFTQVAMLTFALIEQHFGAERSGRATTAANMLIFIVAFLMQYLFGVFVHGWAQRSGVTQPIEAYRFAFAALIVLETIALAWLVISGLRSKPRQAV